MSVNQEEGRPERKAPLAPNALDIPAIPQIIEGEEPAALSR